MTREHVALAADLQLYDDVAVLKHKQLSAELGEVARVNATACPHASAADTVATAAQIPGRHRAGSVGPQAQAPVQARDHHHAHASAHEPWHMPAATTTASPVASEVDHDAEAVPLEYYPWEQPVHALISALSIVY